MHQVHTLNPDCMHRPCALRPGSTHSAVPQAQHRPCRRPSWPCRALYRLAPRGRCCTYRSLLRCIVALPLAVSRPYCYTTQRPSRVPVTIRPFVSRPSLLTARPSHACRSPLRAGLPCRRPCWSYRGAGSAASWPSPGRVEAPRLGPGHTSPSQCHDTIHCFVTQMGSSPFPVSAPFFFFHSSY